MRHFIALLAMLAVLGSACATAVHSPAPVVAGATPESTEQIILDTLPKRGWTAEDVQPGRVVAFIAPRSHLLRVEILYDQRDIRIRYLDSDNLDATKDRAGNVTAHKKVNAWMLNLARDLAAAVSSAAAAPAPAATAGGSTP